MLAKHGGTWMPGPVTLVTPTIKSTPADKKMEKSFLTRKYKKLSFALPSAAAHKAIAGREEKMRADLLQNAAEPTEIKRKVAAEEAEPTITKRRVN